ncbi:MAG: LysR family transcriptional regulator [Hyphomicrobiales bacterium]|nr:LysR family transcriptional regulator [Hyphomicrobiales bacterium]
MDLAAWKVFLDAAEFGSLSKVATAHGTSQPQISRWIRDLERDCGGRLFQRTGRGVALTEFGARVAPKVRAWVASSEQLANDIRTASGTPIGNVRIGSLPSTAHPLLTTVFMRLKKLYPLVQLTVREGQGAQIETWLDEGSVDLAILFRISPKPKDGDIYLFGAPTYLVSAAGDPLTSRATVEFAELDRLPLVLFCRPSGWRNHLEEVAAKHGVSLNAALEADSLGMQTNIVGAGGIYALLGPYAVAAASRTCRLQASKLVAPTVHRHVALAMSPRGKSTLACQAVMRVIRECAKPDLMAANR